MVISKGPVERGSDVPGSVRFRQGGSAANVARAFRGLGGTATFIGSVGTDGWGRRLVSVLRTDGVRVHVVTSAAPTGRLVAIVERGSGERSFITERGAANALAARDIRPAWLRGVGALHLPGYSLFNLPLGEAAARAAELAHGRGVLVSVDLASVGPLLAAGRRPTWTRIQAVAPHLILANAAEAAALAGRLGPARLLELAPVVVVKEGAEGCRVLWREEGDRTLQQAVATTPIATNDTTGAGDAFAAGFLKALLASGGAAASPWGAAALRRAALGGHAAAAHLLRMPRTELVF